MSLRRRRVAGGRRWVEAGWGGQGSAGGAESLGRRRLLRKSDVMAMARAAIPLTAKAERWPVPMPFGTHPPTRSRGTAGRSGKPNYGLAVMRRGD